MIAIVVFYKLNYNGILNYQLKNSKFITEKISKDIDQHLIEKVKKTKTISSAPVITNALLKSNKYYQSLPKRKRDEEILQKNNKWKNIKDQNNSFILDYTNNEVSKYLKILQHNIKGEYGEIFLTNKYGALVASTAKLTTFTHGHKYWWQGAYNDGNGSVFLDDRGYDDSVDGYVLGIVVPIKKDNEIIGILKANLNIIGSINTIVVNSQIKNHEKLKLIRSGGLIVFEEGLEPLSKRISNDLQKRIQTISNESFVFETEGNKFVVGCAEIKISSEMKDYNFGGDFESIDHKKGNSGESWLILDLNPFSNIVKQATGILSGLWIIGILLTVVFAITSFIIGKRIAKPLKELIKKTEQISKGDFDTKIFLNRTDEIGLLASSFNQMTNYLKESTTSIEKLNSVNQQLVLKTKKLKESENKFHSLFSELSEGVALHEIIYDKKGKAIDYRINETNKAFGKILNIKSEDAIGKLSTELYGTEEAPFLDIYAKVAETGNQIEFEQYFLPMKKNFHISAYCPRKGKFATVFSDITEQKQAEERLKKHREHLEEMVELRTENLQRSQQALALLLEDVNESRAELHIANKELQASNKELEAFSYSVSHDLKAPLRAIGGFAQILLEEEGDKLGDEGRDSLNIILKNVDKMAKLIDDLLKFSRLGRKKIHVSEIRTVSLVNNIIKELMEINPDRKIDFKLKKICNINGDNSLLTQVFSNLISNAIKYTRPRENAIVEIGSRKEAGEVIYYVKDNGVGFDMKYVDKIFGVFQRLHSNEEFEGTGIGLALVQRIIKKHGGEVWAEAEVDRGATFYFSLPDSGKA